ncbi:hypothetical protein CVT25_007328 [Psilocybe cyanescens]|uniref:Uncharacterized protein n=1 Tax=Psilocybe cyanescens TaxID=93625 RepID=A0A409WVD3_PSICY|nr:hypothetical protein CVT25_007328 [Psilocybe cyanescens]
MPNITRYDPLPLSGEHTLNDFCRRATQSGPSKNASSEISKIELLKDTRVTEHWTHEYLVFTVIRSGGGAKQEDADSDVLALYFERGLEDHEEWSWRDFIRRGFTGAAADTLSFYEAGGEDDRDLRGWSTSIFEVTLKPTTEGPLRLRHLAQLLASESYAVKHPHYGLFSANCWSWSRGVFFDIIRHHRVAVKEASTFKNGSVSACRKGGEDIGEDEIAMGKEELELFVLTQYGAYGRALLHFTSENFYARYPSFISQYFVRLIILAYSIVGLASTLKCTLNHSSNWTVCLRPIQIGSHKTKDDNGWDLTSTFLSPNFTKLIPWIPVFSHGDLPSSLCSPGRYLYLLTSPLEASPAAVTSVHVFVFGYICPSIPEDQGVNSEYHSKGEDGGDGEQNPDLTCLWLSCAIIRPSADRTRIIHIGDIHEVRIEPRSKHESNVHYSAICILNRNHPLTTAIRHGDAIGIWAHSHEGMTHVPRIASIKVVAHRPIGMLDILLIVYLTWEMHQLSQVGPSSRMFQGILMCLPYLLRIRFEGWVWTNLAIFARVLHKQIIHGRYGVLDSGNK